MHLGRATVGHWGSITHPLGSAWRARVCYNSAGGTLLAYDLSDAAFMITPQARRAHRSGDAAAGAMPAAASLPQQNPALPDGATLA